MADQTVLWEQAWDSLNRARAGEVSPLIARVHCLDAAKATTGAQNSHIREGFTLCAGLLSARPVDWEAVDRVCPE